MSERVLSKIKKIERYQVHIITNKFLLAISEIFSKKNPQKVGYGCMHHTLS
jgi:hypothetical protein